MDSLVITNTVFNINKKKNVPGNENGREWFGVYMKKYLDSEMLIMI